MSNHFDNRTDAQKKTAAKKHYLGALFHSVFYDNEQRDRPIVGDTVMSSTANTLVRNKMAMIHTFPMPDGSIKVCLGMMKSGCKVYGENANLWTIVDGKTTSISSYPRYKHERVFINSVRDACYKLTNGKFSLKGL